MKKLLFCCPRMKYKSRVAASGLGVALLLVAGIIILDASSGNVRYTDEKLQTHPKDKRDLVKDQVEIKDGHDKTNIQERHDEAAAPTTRKPNKQGIDDANKNNVNDDVTPSPTTRKHEGHVHAGVAVETPATKKPELEGSKYHKTVMHNEDVERLLNILESRSSFGFERDFLRGTSFKDMAIQLGKKGREKSRLLLQWDTHELRDDRTSNFIRFHHGIKAAAMYDPEDPAIDGLLHDMATDTIKTLDMIERGTELKLLIWFRKGTKAVFKPMRWGREVETLPNHFYFNDFERHNSEIAAFHLDRILGFYRVPPVTGRFLNMTKEIYDLAERALQKTFYVSPVGNTCFFGVCDYYCDSNHAFCGKGDIIEGSLMVWLPEGRDAKRDSWKSPYRRSYSKFRKADWETDDNYCQNYMKHSSTLYKRYIPDLIDSHIFDFITGNMDRHHMEVFERLKNDSCPIHLDNGRGFGKANVDEYSIITPLKQCCRVRKSTFLKLAKLYIGPERLGDMLDKSLKSDPLYPVLMPDYYNAMDRRVLHILTVVADCTFKYGVDKVILADGF